MKIEWASDFHADGSRRRYPIPNAMHGWLAKMRGTISGNEDLRSKGMREMENARVYKKELKRRGQSHKSSAGFLSSFFGPPKSRSSGQRRPSSRPSYRTARRRASSHRLVGQGQRASRRMSVASSKPSAQPRRSSTMPVSPTPPRRSSGTKVSSRANVARHTYSGVRRQTR